ncbi:IS200/IS605 family transposase [Helcococcus ovis]|uniref:IS200/IS605 family transposase n=1 Tax=Helcococcus ovis TaxID=72026 RepID=UPI0038B7F724
MRANGSSHTVWNCNYYIVFTPKYEKLRMYKEIKEDIGRIIRNLLTKKGIKIIEAELCSNYIYMLIEIPPKYSVSQIIGYLKGKSSLLIFERKENLRYAYKDRSFWCRGYYVDTSRRDESKIHLYVKNQLKEDYKINQMSVAKVYDVRE